MRSRKTTDCGGSSSSRRLRHAGGAAAAATLAFTGVAQGHPVPPAPAVPPFPWSFEPWVIACLLLSLALYTRGAARLWQRAGIGRGLRARHIGAFAVGWLTLVAALVSPLDPLGNRLFSAHMVQHELLMVVAAPLMCLGQPVVAWLWALPTAWRRALAAAASHAAWRALWGRLSAPTAAWALHAVVLWAWHLPAAFDASLADATVHTWQHISFLSSALLFWWAVLRGEGGLLYVFTTMVHTTALGALLTLSPVVWYLPYQASAGALGFSALEDQQLGGLVMWVPAGMAYLGAGLLLVARWLSWDGPARGAGAPP